MLGLFVLALASCATNTGAQTLPPDTGGQPEIWGFIYGAFHGIATPFAVIAKEFINDKYEVYQPRASHEFYAIGYLFGVYAIVVFLVRRFL